MEHEESGKVYSVTEVLNAEMNSVVCDTEELTVGGLWTNVF